VRVVIDTNVLLAGLLWRGPPHAVLEYVRLGKLAMVSSPELLAELTEVIGRPKFDTILARIHTSREAALAEMRHLAEVIDPPPLPHPVCRDPDDDHVLALALAAQVDLIISGDEDLLVLQSYEGMPIVSPAHAVETLIRAHPSP
jgi:putative PIN family toxin of toxin-antitoxin system